MATITLQETFRVGAPIEEVWRFVMDAERVAACMPGARLEPMVDERIFHGSIRVKVGAITTSYKGRVQLVEVDETLRAVRMIAEGREMGGGTAKGTMSSRLEALADGETEVVVESSVDITGRVAQMGRGMIQGVSQQLFQQFVSAAKAQLEAGEGQAVAAAPSNEAISVIPLVLRVIWSAIVGFVKRLLRLGR